MKRSLFVDIVSCLYILLFLYTGVMKLLNHTYFRLAVEKSPMHSFATPLSFFVPITELLIATALMIPFFTDRPRLRKWGLYSGTALMAAFTIYVGWMLKFAPGLPCTCGGIIQQMNWHQHFYFNTTYTFLGALAIWMNRRYDGEKSSLTLMHS